MRLNSLGFVIAAALYVAVARAEDLNVLPRSDKAQRQTMLRDYLRPKVHAALDRRLAQYEQLKTPDQIAAYQNQLRAKFVESLGGFPEKTPLKARIVGTITGDGYRAEKIIYESRPGFSVPAVLYLPESKPPHPGVLLPCGHSENGKAAGAYQRVGILLAKNGIAVLCYDPIGQGERKQILATDEQGRRLAKGRFKATSEHMFDGVAPILLGQNLATFRIWDGMRGIDYLTSRKDIDPTRIGCTGNSGGGLMTSYLMAIDDRIVAAAPSCFITTTRRKNESPGPGDAEQNIFGQIAYGMDHPDYILMRAPKPTLICAATQDFVPIEGTWEAFRQAKRLYTRMGFAQHVDLIEADEKHGFSRHLRVGAARWMRRWLLGRDDAITETDFPIHTDRQLQCTPAGQVLMMKDARSIFDINQATAAELARDRTKRWRVLSSEQRIERIRQLAGIRKMAELERPRVAKKGELRRDGYKIEKLLLESEKGILLPALLFVPDRPSGKATLYVHGDGKHTDAHPGGPIERLVRQGQHVLAVDLRGLGETETTPWRYSAQYMGHNSAEYFIAYMLGRSLVGMRAEDTLVGARYLAGISQHETKVHFVATGKAGIPVLHAAATHPQLFASGRLQGCLNTWTHVVQTPVTVDQLENTVHAALKQYDLPDLIELMGAEKVRLEDPIARPDA